MRGLPWYSHDIAAYDEDTGDLSLVEHGAYRRMLDHYYKTAAPLPLGAQQIFRICCATTRPEKRAVVVILARYFTRCDDSYRHARCDAELQKMAEIRGKRQDAARKSHASAQANASANADTVYTSPPTKEENNNLSFNGMGKKNGQGNGVTIKDPAKRLAIFQKTLADSFRDKGWEIVAAAADPASPNYAVALETCKTQARLIGKGWPKQWPV